MPRFLSRAGTNIDDLERQLARVGSAENEEALSPPADEAGAGAPATERTPLIHISGPGSTSHTLLSSRSPHLDSRSADDTPTQSFASSSAAAAAHTLLTVGDGTRQSMLRLRQSDETQMQSQDGGGDIGWLGAQQQQRQRQAVTSSGAAPRKLGTWDGVFMPVTLTIWGILVYVRMGFFISQVGVVGTIGSFVCGYTVTTLTTLSISAISTNGTVKGGGPYYMLSRSLGPEFGGSIGLMFYIGTLLAGALNAVAFVEPMMNNFGSKGGDVLQVLPEGPWWDILYSSVLLALCTVVCLRGAQMFAKASTFLSAVIIASIVMIMASFALRAPFEDETRGVYYSGWSAETLRENMWPELVAESYSSVLGVLFPACIGIMAGASMSSQLRKPSKSIPKGTLWGVGVTFVLYIALAVSLGSTTRRATLRSNYNVLQEINIVPLVVAVGALTTSVTSTLSGLLSAASVLQAIAKDDLFAVLAPLKRVGRNDSPTRAIFATYAISQVAFFVGDTNAVAPYTTMFNLIMFAFVNVACLVLKLAASVNFRPTFQYFKAWTAAVGAVGCFATMLFVDALSALASTAVVVVLFAYVHYTCPPKPWGDVTQSLIYHQCRKFMLRLDLRKDHVKFWRPQILLLVHNPRNSLHLIRFCNALKKGGLYVIGHVIKREDFGHAMSEFRRQEPAWLRLIDVLGVKAFLNMAVDKSDDAGARSIVFGAGLGGMRPNIVVMGFFNFLAGREAADGSVSSQLTYNGQEQHQRKEVLPTDGIELNTPISPTAYLRIIEDVLTMGKALGIAHGFSGLEMQHGLSGLHMPAPTTDQAGQKKSSSAPGQPTQYIDLWPIQIGSAATTAAVSSDGRHTYLTNFDSYVMVLQLGTVLHLVPYWNKRYTLRVMCFVEDQRDVDEEYRRVAKLLRDLRVVAELHVHHMRGAGLETYDRAVRAASSSSSAAGPVVQAQHAVQPVPLPPNSRVRQHCSRTTGGGGESPSTPGGFSMRVNLPMPLRYEATRLEAVSGSLGADRSGPGAIGGNSINNNGGGSSSSSSSSSHHELSGSESESDTDEHGSLQPPSPPPAAAGDPHFLAQRGLSGRRRNTSSYGSSGAGVVWDLQRRRRSDGSMVLSNLYPHALAALAIEAVPGKADSTLVSSSYVSSQTTPPDTEFNDMPIGTQNRILNEMMRRESSKGGGSTAVIFTTLQAPEPGTSESETKSMEYLRDIDTLASGLPPVFLVHATSLTVTTSL
ncbi:hypothetical protein GGH99_004033 [Coemansia sp. RSA 1285]|nr:hypothetical protein GGH99_004033 [Coemansia sp. RSA 1285]